MDKNEYIKKLAMLIKNRVKFHAPKSIDEQVDFELLDAVGINKNLPIFVFKKKMTKVFVKAFILAQKEVDFNLILPSESSLKQTWLKRLKNVHFIDENSCGFSLNYCIEKLNINYLTHSSFSPRISKHYIKINEQEVSLDFTQFYLHKKQQCNGVIFDIKKFLLNGINISTTFLNPYNEVKSIYFEVNIPLPNGYYNFSKVKTGVKIKNLTSKDVSYFNYNCQANLSFSCIDGLESSTRACVNLSAKITLHPHEQRRVYFNYGDNAYMFNSPKLVDQFFLLSQQKTFEKFPIKINSRDKAFDDRFNNILPNKIWLAWAGDTIDEASEIEYLKLKSSIITEKEKGYFINENFKGLKEVKIYQNGSFKRVFIVQSDSRYIFAEKTKFFNFTQIAKQFFDKNNEIYLSFGK